ncbi:MAG: nicotinate (nicotinamide) nucleotide adenylyltransferase [Verrucomicrobiae bacterium]|nr:nicotinate (nicotinamide) nucleotide adenylyltransferase [Verrucomicrobiae bacterium]
MKIAIYGGTFDPVHQGHLILARTALETFRWDKLYFVPCAQSPHKKHNPVASNQDRLKMLQLAIKGETRLKVDDFEIRQGGISYSIDTVSYFQKKFPRAKLFWLLGSDQIAKLKTWHRFEELKQKVTFTFLNRDETKKGALRNKFLLTRRIDISATAIRSRIKKCLSIRYLVTEEVAHYIKRKKIYSS